MGKSTTIKRFELSGVENKGPKLRKKQCLLFFVVFVVVVVFFSGHTVCIFAKFNLLRSRGKMAH